MIQGQVTPSREAVVPLVVRGPSGQEVDIEAAIDTGFTEYLTLSLAIITLLGLRFRTTTPVILADGSVILVSVYRATVLWDGHPRLVEVHEAEGGPLVGMSMLYGSRLTIDVLDGGPVTIEALP